MSHHFDISTAKQDISDVLCFDGPSDDDGPRTVIGMNASPQDLQNPGDTIDSPWDPVTLYELKLDLNGDFVEDITWRFTFPPPLHRHTVRASGAAQRPGRHQPYRPRHDHHPPQRAGGRGP